VCPRNHVYTVYSEPVDYYEHLRHTPQFNVEPPLPPRRALQLYPVVEEDKAL
jgi:hypothetical protein